MSHDTPEPGPNRIKVAHLVLGLVFVGITVVWALAEAGSLDWHGSRYAGPAILVGAGAAGLAASLAGGRRRPARRTRPVDDRTDQDATDATPETTAVTEPHQEDER